MLKKIICLGMVAVAFFSACDGSSDTMSGSDELESSSSAFSSSSSFFQQQTNPVVPPNGSSSSSSLNASSVSYGTLVDSRDGQVYKTVVIGTQTWMAEDLNYHDSRFSSKDSLVGSYTWAEAVDSAGLFSLGALNCKGTGVDERCAMPDNVRGICPEGWHIPSRKEWNELLSLLSRGRYDGTKEASIEGELLKTFQSTCNLYGFSLRGVFWLPHSYFVFQKTRFVGENFYFGVNENEVFFSCELLYGFSDPQYGKIRCLQDDDVTTDSISNVTTGTMTDSRDGRSYKTVTIGSQTWMAENLNYETDSSYCYDADTANCTKYGRLYTRAASENVCPRGWHLPTLEEWKTLFIEVGDSTNAGSILKSTTGWETTSGGPGGCSTKGDAFAFAVRPAGYMADDGSFHDAGSRAWLWSSIDVYGIELDCDYSGVFLWNWKDAGASVRCIQGDEKMASPSRSMATGTMTDSRDGQTYKTVTIGTQTWMAENLDYETYKSRYYSVSYDSTDTKYGRFYTWIEATTACPNDWHLPSKAEWETLFSAVGGQASAGLALKSASGWDTYGGGIISANAAFSFGIDAYSFAALPGGYIVTGNNDQGGYAAYFWSSTEGDGLNANGAYSAHFVYDMADAQLLRNSKGYYLSVRCLRDNVPEQKIQSSSSSVKSSSSKILQSSSSKITSSSSWSVVMGTMTDSRDGQTYKIINIGTQTWMAQNLNYKTENSYCYENDASNCTRYGRLYVWDTATTVCPNGWLLPSKAEWETLFSAVGGLSTVLEVLKSTTGWDNNANGTDAFSFAAYPAGIYAGKNRFDFLGKYAFFWSSTEDGGDSAYLLSMGAGMAQFTSIFGKEVGTSVRCVKDSE